MSGTTQSDPKPTTGMGIGIYFIAGPMVVLIAGLGGALGRRVSGGPGYWVGCYLAGILAAAIVAAISARRFGGHPLYWAFGAVGMLLGGHLTFIALGGKPGEAPLSESNQFLVRCAAVVGLVLGFALAHPIVARSAKRPPG
jgi:hypothetical protein